MCKAILFAAEICLQCHRPSGFRCGLFLWVHMWTRYHRWIYHQCQFGLHALRFFRSTQRRPCQEQVSIFYHLCQVSRKLVHIFLCWSLPFRHLRNLTFWEANFDSNRKAKQPKWLFLELFFPWFVIKIRVLNTNSWIGAF